MSTTAPPPPRVMFGPYRLDGLLGHGPSATVYRAVDSSHGNRVVALKVFSPQLSADAGFRERFRHDASVLGALREPHIVPIHRYGEIDDLAYLDMRLVRGPTLDEALRHGALDPARAAAVAEQVRSALAAMVRAGLGHRPVHASEVLLTGSPDRGEFVQLVGLGLGRPPVSPGDAASDALLARGATPRPSRRRSPPAAPRGRRNRRRTRYGTRRRPRGAVRVRRRGRARGAGRAARADGDDQHAGRHDHRRRHRRARRAPGRRRRGRRRLHPHLGPRHRRGRPPVRSPARRTAWRPARSTAGPSWSPAQPTARWRSTTSTTAHRSRPPPAPGSSRPRVRWRAPRWTACLRWSRPGTRGPCSRRGPSRRDHRRSGCSC